MTSNRSSTKTLDKQDQDILARRVATLNKDASPRVGDWVKFSDGIMRRISHIRSHDIQTSDRGRYYLGDGCVMFMSGDLFHAISTDSLALADEVRPGSVWFFHHDYPREGNSVDVTIPFRVYACSNNTVLY